MSGIPGINATNLGILQKYVPAAPAATTTVPVGNFSVPVGVLPIAAPNFQNNYNAVASTDYNLSDRDQIRGRFVYNHISFIDTAATLPVFYTTVPQKAYLATFTEYHTFSPALTNEFRLGYNRLFQDYPAGNFSFPGLDQFPNLTFDDLSLQVGPDPNAPQSQSQNTYQATDNVTWVRGQSHVQVRRRCAPVHRTADRLRSDCAAITSIRRSSLYLRDIAPDVFGERTLGQPRYYGNQTASYSFAQDTWRIRPNLSLNLGVRYEYTSQPFSAGTQTLNAISSVPGVLQFNNPKAQTNAFAPRIGVAYSPGTSGNTSIRAGFGMAYDVLFDNIAILSLPPQLTTTADITNAQFANLVGVPGFLAHGGFSPSTSVTGQLTAGSGTAEYLRLHPESSASVFRPVEFRRAACVCARLHVRGPLSGHPRHSPPHAAADQPLFSGYAGQPDPDVLYRPQHRHACRASAHRRRPAKYGQRAAAVRRRRVYQRHHRVDA